MFYMPRKANRLTVCSAFGYRYDFILVSAVWMHIHPDDRFKALSVLAALLKADGKIYLSLRHGPEQPSRGIYNVSVEEVRALAEANGLTAKDLGKSPDLLGRSDIIWRSIELSPSDS